MGCVDESLFRDLHKLTKLTLGGNGINEIRAGTFTGLQDLKHLDLSDNLLISIPVLSSIINMPMPDSGGVYLDMSNNPLLCSTNLCWLHKDPIFTTGNAMCTSPANMNGVMFDDLTFEDIDCDAGELVMIVLKKMNSSEP